jgi:hypothetical protein
MPTRSTIRQTRENEAPFGGLESGVPSSQRGNWRIPEIAERPYSLADDADDIFTSDSVADYPLRVKRNRGRFIGMVAATVLYFVSCTPGSLPEVEDVSLDPVPAVSAPYDSGEVRTLDGDNVVRYSSDGLCTQYFDAIDCSF